MTKGLGPGGRKELIWVLVVVLGLGLAGIWLDSLTITLLLGSLIYLGWQLTNHYRLHAWLNQKKLPHPPKSKGTWNDIYLLIHQHQQIINKRKHKLRRAFQRFNRSTACLPDATVLLGKHGQIEWWNKAAERLLGLLQERDSGQPITSVIRHPDFVDSIQKNEWEKPLEIPSPVDGAKWLTLHSGCTAKHKRLLQARDTTRLHRLEQMRRDFISNVSHELRTPLTVISGYVESLLETEEIRNGPLHGIISQISTQGQRMQRIVDDLLLLSRLELDEEKPAQDTVPIGPMLHRIRADALALSGNGHHHIKMSLDPNVELIGNANDLRSAFSNLVFNAVRYTPPCGEINLQWLANEEGACFTVSDTGVGIESHHIPRLTERFYRVDIGRSRQKGGTGLGLAIVKHVLNRHNGELSIHSEVGKGSTFTCRFPAKRVRNSPRT